MDTQHRVGLRHVLFHFAVDTVSENESGEEGEDMTEAKELEGDRELVIQAMLFGKYRLYVGKRGALWYDDGW